MDYSKYMEFKALIKCARYIKRRLRDDWDMVVTITGTEGVGKSTLAIHLGILIDHDFDLDKNIGYLPSHQDFIEKFESLDRYQVFLVDEALKSLYKMRFMTKLQQDITIHYGTERWQNKCTILCIPRFRDLTESFRNHKTHVWIHCMDRGKAVVFFNSHVNMFGTDAWSMDINEKMIRDKLGAGIFANEKKKLTVYKKTTNFYSLLSFPDLDDDMKERYNELKAQSRKESKDIQGDTIGIREKKYRSSLAKVFMHMMAKHGYTQRQIAEICGVSHVFIHKSIKRETEFAV